MHHHASIAAKQAVGLIRPHQHVQAVLPAHLYLRASAIAVPVEVGQQDVATQTTVHASYAQHAYGIVRIAVYDDRRARCGVGGCHVEGMEGDTRIVLQVNVVQGTCRLQAVQPLGHAGIGGADILHGGSHVAATGGKGVGLQGVAKHVISGTEQCRSQPGKQGEAILKRLLHACRDVIVARFPMPRMPGGGASPSRSSPLRPGPFLSS